MEDARPICNWPLDKNGLANIRDMVEPPGGCRLPPGLRGWKSDVSLVDENGHPADSDDPAADKCNHRDTPEWKAKHHRATVRVQPKKETPVPAQAAQIPEAPATALPAPQSASVAVPAAPTADDLARVAQGAGGGLNGIVMALIAVAGGGGAIWKYLQSKQKAAAKKDELEHEQRMKELDLQQKSNEDQHKACDAAREALAARVAALDERVTSLSFNIRDMQSRLQELMDKLDKIQDALVKLAADDRELEERLEELEEADELKSKRKSR
jgi:uncharacterized protein HemX